jgi:predicted DCC family thiol-disulfide oxidoreductase YuxK/uncharacterized membrane protein YphA (DoxX/SURF4 family)
MLTDRIDSWLFKEYASDATSLGVARILFGVVLLTYALPGWTWIPGMAPSFYFPPLGLASFFRAPPPGMFFIVLNIIAIVSGVCMLVGLHTRTASVLVGTSLLVGNSFGYAFGKIDHTILLVLVPLAGGAADWGRSLSMDSQRSGVARGQPPAWPLALLALLIGYAMFYAGYGKLMTGWLDPTRLAFRNVLILNHFSTGRSHALSSIALKVPAGPVWELADWVAVGLEMAFLPAVLRRSWFVALCGVACLFHLANAVLLEISFAANVIAYSTFVRWRETQMPQRLDPLVRRLTSPAKVMVGAFALAALYLSVGNPLKVLFSSVGIEPSWILPMPVIIAGVIVPIGWLVRHAPVFVHRAPLTMGAITPLPVLQGRPLVLFDGVCGLCNFWVDFVLKYDLRRRFRFTALQSAVGEEVLKAVGLPGDYVDSIVLVDEGVVYSRSSAILVILRHLGGGWRLISVVLGCVPVFMRDFLYNEIAARRYAWFGRRDTCRLPTPEERDSFV